MSGVASGAHPYAGADYARALSHMGEAIAVPEWGTHVLARVLPCGNERDVIGSYPLAVLAPDADLSAGVTRLAEQGLVSLVLVADPLRGPSRDALSAAFSLCRPFKTHHIIDPIRGYAPTKHHRDRIRRGLRRCRVERVALRDHLSAWRSLYTGLAEKRGIGGAAAFGDCYFDMLARDDRMTTFAAFVEDEIAAMTIWFAHDGVVYNHLTASSAAGYANSASFALYDAAIARFAGEGVINLGGGAGFTDDPDDGLAAFKRGFANGAVEALLCGAVLDDARYAALSRGRDTTFFPAYRG